MNETAHTHRVALASVDMLDALPSVLPVEDVLVVLPAEDIPSAVPVLEEVLPGSPTPSRSILGRVWHGTCSACEWFFGAATLVVGLAVLAAVPILQFLTLGYLLEAGGRVARTGKLRSGFIGVRIAARAGGMVLGAWLVLLPLRLVSSLWLSAEIIDPDGPTART